MLEDKLYFHSTYYEDIQFVLCRKNSLYQTKKGRV